MMLKRELTFLAQITGLLTVRDAATRFVMRRAPYRVAAFMGCVDNWTSTDPANMCTGFTWSCSVCPLRKEGGTP